MTSLKDRPHTALLVIDMQTGVVAGAHERDAVVGRTRALVDKARRQGAPVVWVQHADGHLERGSPAWQLVPELTVGHGEALVDKSFADAFEGTTLEATLATLGVGRLVVAGAQTDECIRATIHGACVRGYDVTLVGDAHTTEDHTAWGAPPPAQVVAHTNLYWAGHRAPGREASVAGTDHVEFGTAAG